MKKSFPVKAFAFPLFCVAGVVLIVCSATVKQGVADGLTLCGDTLIPSLFIFLCLCNTAMGYSEIPIPIISRVYAALFHAPVNTAVLFLLSLVGGYPVGPMLCARMLEEKKITPSQAKYLPLFCCCSGPAFSVLAVGESMCGSKTTGIILLFSTLLPQIILGIAIGLFTRKRAPGKAIRLYKDVPAFSRNFTEGVEKSIAGMIHICAYVILFCVVLRFVKLLPIPQTVQKYICAFLEVTTGAKCFANNIPMVAFILGFGGISVLLQIKKYLSLTGTNIALFLLSRLASGTLAFLICKGLLCLFPQSIPTLAGGLHIHAVSFSAPLSAMLVISFCVFVMGDKF